MIIRDAGWAASAAAIFGLCWWLCAWGSWPRTQSPTEAIVASTPDRPAVYPLTQPIISNVKGAKSRQHSAR
jgi:hypothetical protein